MESKALLEYMEENKGDFVEKLKKVVMIETPTQGNKEDLKECRNYFADIFANLGFKSKELESNDEKYGNHLLLEYGEGEEQVLFVGHYDTVYDKGTFGKKTWEVVENKIIGPGVLDMKGGNIQAYMVAKSLIELNLFPKNKRMTVLLSADEEAGSYTSNEYYKDQAKKSKAAFVMEPAKGDYIGGVKKGRYGRGNYTFYAKGISAHSGLEPERGESALIELSKQAIDLENLTTKDKSMTVACTCLKSGNSGYPTVPGEGELTIDARFSTIDLANEYDNFFKNLKVYNPQIKITTKGTIEKPPYNSNEDYNQKLFNKAVQIGKEFNLDIKGEIVRSGSDGNFTSYVGCPTLDGLGMTGDYVHRPGKEYINLEHVPIRGAFLAKLVLSVLND